MEYRCIRCERIFREKEIKRIFWLRKVKGFLLRRPAIRVCPYNFCRGRLVKYIGREKMVINPRAEAGKARLN